MTSDDLRAIAREIYGPGKVDIVRLARDLEYEYTQIWRIVNGKYPINPRMEKRVLDLQARFRAGGMKPDKWWMDEPRAIDDEF